MVGNTHTKGEPHMHKHSVSATFVQSKSTDVLSSFLLPYAIRLSTVQKSSNLILSYAFNTFGTMCNTSILLARHHICVTLLITHIQIDYHLFINCWLFQVIMEISVTSTNIDEIMLNRHVFARNERIWQIKVSLCPAKRDINR